MIIKHQALYTYTYVYVYIYILKTCKSPFTSAYALSRMFRLSISLVIALVSSTISHKLPHGFFGRSEPFANEIDDLYSKDYRGSPGFLREPIESEAENEADEHVPLSYIGEQLLEIPLGTPEEEKNVPGEPLTPEDFANAKKIEILAPVMDENSPDPIQTAGLFEGDIAGINVSDISVNSDKRNAIRNMNQRWHEGIIPYVISSAFSLYERSVIAAAFLDYQSNTCIRFIPRTRQRDYIYLLKGSGCSSNVGRSGSGQQISLGPGCVYKGVIIHELMHAVGFWHEQSRTDRDDYVTVLWQNIIPGMEYNFNKYSWNMIQTLGVPYDTSSVMHYTRLSFSKDGRSPTIVPKNPKVDFIGQRTGFSNSDLMKINRLYRCNDDLVVKPPVIKPVVPENKCLNNHRFCDYWSKLGECWKNPSWMLVNCKKSCRQCGQQCNNYNKDCEYWARIGECAKNPSYMTIYCAKSCNTCQ